jgi:hypothetical protein
VEAFGIRPVFQQPTWPAAMPSTSYQQLFASEGERLDAYVLDVCISIVRFVDGEDPQPWWCYTAERKRRFPDL